MTHYLLDVYFGINLLLFGRHYDKMQGENRFVGANVLFWLFMLFCAGPVVLYGLLADCLTEVVTTLQIKFFWQFYVQRKFRDVSPEQLNKFRIWHKSTLNGHTLRDRIFRFSLQLIADANAHPTDPDQI